MNYHVKSIVKLTAFTNIELILVLLISITIIPLTYQYINILISLKGQTNYSIEDSVGIYQLRIYLACNNILEINDKFIAIQTEDSKLKLQETNNKIMLKKGSLTFLTNVSDTFFYLDDDSIYISFNRDNNEYTYWLAAY